MVADLSEVELLKVIERQVCDLETESAAAWLQAKGLPADDSAVKHLAFSRYLLVTLRLTEHAFVTKGQVAA